MPDVARAETNRASVRELLATRQPAFAAWLAQAEAALDAELTRAGSRSEQQPGMPGGMRQRDVRLPRPAGRSASAGQRFGPRRLDPDCELEAGM
jgi:hypothetical protein